MTCFGGMITGRNVELLPNERVVQAWRAGTWEPGDYSIARFALMPEGAGTLLIFDHTGFPQGQSEHVGARLFPHASRRFSYRCCLGAGARLHYSYTRSGGRHATW